MLNLKGKRLWITKEKIRNRINSSWEQKRRLELEALKFNKNKSMYYKLI